MATTALIRWSIWLSLLIPLSVLASQPEVGKISAVDDLAYSITMDSGTVYLLVPNAPVHTRAGQVGFSLLEAGQEVEVVFNKQGQATEVIILSPLSESALMH